jgi:Rhodopirellula transposase DDE domain
MIDEKSIALRFEAVRPSLDERARRLHVAAEAHSAGDGGVAATARATGVARSTIGRGLKDLRDATPVHGRVRRPGAGRRKLTAKDPTLLTDLETLLEPATMGDPMRPLRWVSKSHDKLATALCEMGHRVSASSLPKLLEALDYRRHVNRKTKDGGSHPDRDGQFEYINAKAREFQAAEQPVISVDTKKKELIGEFKNPGSDYGPKGEPIKVDAHDFENKALGKVVPYGVYDVGANSGYVSLGIDHDTAPFAVNATKLWLEKMGHERYPDLSKIMITADCGGSNGPRLRLWKVELQRLADETGLILQVCHYPPGTSKWNKIEHRMFCHISENWRATPLTSRLTVVELIANTRTKTGLTIRCELDTKSYPKGIKVSDQEIANLNLKGDNFHPEWNYTILPREQKVGR